jgi:hypothetical protein
MLVHIVPGAMMLGIEDQVQMFQVESEPRVWKSHGFGMQATAWKRMSSR